MHNLLIERIREMDKELVFVVAELGNTQFRLVPATDLVQPTLQFEAASEGVAHGKHGHNHRNALEEVVDAASILSGGVGWGFSNKEEQSRGHALGKCARNARRTQGHHATTYRTQPHEPQQPEQGDELCGEESVWLWCGCVDC